MSCELGFENNDLQGGSILGDDLAEVVKQMDERVETDKKSYKKPFEEPAILVYAKGVCGNAVLLADVGKYVEIVCEGQLISGYTDGEDSPVKKNCEGCFYFK